MIRKSIAIAAVVAVIGAAVVYFLYQPAGIPQRQAAGGADAFPPVSLELVADADGRSGDGFRAEGQEVAVVAPEAEEGAAEILPEDRIVAVSFTDPGLGTDGIGGSDRRLAAVADLTPYSSGAGRHGGYIPRSGGSGNRSSHYSGISGGGSSGVTGGTISRRSAAVTESAVQPDRSAPVNSSLVPVSSPVAARLPAAAATQPILAAVTPPAPKARVPAVQPLPDTGGSVPQPAPRTATVPGDTQSPAKDLPPEEDVAEAPEPTEPDAEPDYFSPGHSPGIADWDGDFTLSDVGNLLIEIRGPVPGDDFDVLNVAGVANLDAGNIFFAFINDYKPSVDEVFQFLTAAGGIVMGDEQDVHWYYGVFSDPLHGGKDFPNGYGSASPWGDLSLFVGGTDHELSLYVNAIPTGTGVEEISDSTTAGNTSPTLDTNDFYSPGAVPAPATLVLIFLGFALLVLSRVKTARVAVTE